MTDWSTTASLATAGGTFGAGPGDVRVDPVGQPGGAGGGDGDAGRPPPAAADVPAALSQAIAARSRMMVDLLYGDFEGGQRTITRVALTWRADTLLASTSRHWTLDRTNPR